MRGEILLRPQEARRVYVLERLAAGELTISQGAELLGLSPRQVQRLKQAFRKDGPASLVHGNRGRRPRHATPDAIRQLVVELAGSTCQGASCAQLSERLLEHRQVTISAKTITRILAQSAIPNRHTHRPPRKTRCRERMPREGLLIQLDASPYAWLEDRGPKLSLHGAIDDATSKVLGLVFAPQETLHAYLTLMQQVIQDHGVPQSIYSDRHTIFFSPKRDQLSIDDQLQGRVAGCTQFGEALSELGINQVAARSPQAKGRIERLWRTLQSRLLVELRLQGIATLEDANRFLPDFLQRYNQRFSVPPAHLEPAYRPAPSQLERILAQRAYRQTKGSVIRYLDQTYRLLTARGTMARLPDRTSVTVLLHLDGTMSARVGHQHYQLQPFTQPPKAASAPAPKTPKVPHKPAPNHPWRKPAIKRSQPPAAS